MEEWRKQLELRSKAVLTRRIAAAAQLDRGPCLLMGVSLANDATGEGSVSLYDGEGTTGEQKLDYAVVDGATFGQDYDPPVYFAKGLYAGTLTKLTSLTVRWIPIRE